MSTAIAEKSLEKPVERITSAASDTKALDNTRFASAPLFTQLSRAVHDASHRHGAPQSVAEISITPTGGGVGGVVRNLDANRPLSAALVSHLQQALDEHGILIFKQQRLADEALLAFSTYFGPVFHSPADVPVLGSSDHGGTAPDVVPVANVEGGYTGHGELLPHTDHQWTPLPSAASLLYAVEVPAQGGDTTWYNLAQAYADLDADTRARIDTLQLITYNPFVRTAGQKRPLYRTPDIAPLGHAFPHPLVRTHPRSGKKILFLATHSEVELVGVAPEVGVALIAFLRAHIQQPKYQYTHRWEVGDIVHWDNQATLHARTAFDANDKRVLKRVSLAGARPF
ncbi:TauD/TfdA family dioxygenase [Uliginosibacterium sp. H3]|uniref:TauD/TfdA family dioxygenase n=1 Tax=Uliginosibacterium silvisoli TaxID=3114758 RepID=A0ABU6K718_9RHOO|nr:TauD/TfdA family dioxygenase [Uliginosibacterium sp. H3]